MKTFYRIAVTMALFFTTVNTAMAGFFGPFEPPNGTVPEPSTLMLVPLGIAAVGLAHYIARKRK